MNLTFKLALVFFLLLTLSCKERHLFSDQSELATVTRDFEDKQKALPLGKLPEPVQYKRTIDKRPPV